jgi:hypothetical protein
MITGRDSLGSRYLYFNVSGRGFNFHFTCLVADDDVLVVPLISASLVIAESNIASACFSSVSRFMSPPYVVRHSPNGRHCSAHLPSPLLSLLSSRYF